MPNWCNCNMILTLPEKYYDDFFDLFGEYPSDIIGKKVNKFYRSFVDYDDYIEVDNEDVPMIQINVDFNCAWSFWVSLIYPNNTRNTHCNFISIFDAIKKFDIKNITMNSYEYDMLFEEEFNYDDSIDKATYKRFNMPQYQNLLDDTEIESNEDNIANLYTEAFIIKPKIKVLSNRDLLSDIEFLNIKYKGSMKIVTKKYGNRNGGDLVE